MTMKIRKAFT